MGDAPNPDETPRDQHQNDGTSNEPEHLADGGERLMTQQHAIDVTDVCLRAQAAARPWGHPPT